MARSFTAALMRAARASDRAHRASVRGQIAYGRAMERQARAMERAQKQYYLEGRAEEVDDLNEELAEQNEALASLLSDSLATKSAIEFQALRQKLDLSELPQALQNLDGPDPQRFAPKPLSFIDKLVPGATKRFELARVEGTRLFQTAVEEHAELMSRRAAAIGSLESAVKSHNEEIRQFEAAVESGEAEATKAYYELVLANSEYPDNFPRLRTHCVIARR